LINKTIKYLLACVGVGVGIMVSILVENKLGFSFRTELIYSILIYASIGTIFALLFSIGGSKVIILITRSISSLENAIQVRNFPETISGVIGLIIGLIIANLISIPIIKIPLLGIWLSIAANLILGYVGVRTGVKYKDETSNIGSRLNIKKNITKKNAKVKPKILDTSVIIDGRIADICKTGFIEGSLIIPSFVLNELQHIADSSDSLKRNRGRRGLDILNTLQKEISVEVEMLEKDYPDIPEVDSKLLKLAQDVNGEVLTNDFNLNKVASFKGVKVLNINELANAIKPIVLPGEEMVVYVVKDGKEYNQGVAYLDDGTMIVVEEGKSYIGQQLSVLVTSVLQTSAGRMIFAKPKSKYEEKAV
jgi:uncharacterized protein YacL